MWNLERKPVKSIFVAVLLSVTGGAMGQDVQSEALKAPGGDMRIARSGAYEVRGVALRLDRRKCNVGVGRITFTPKHGIAADQCATAINAETRSAVTALKFRGGKTVKLRTAFVADRPIVRLDLPAVAGEVVIELTGADRLAFATANGFAAQALAGGDRTIALPAAGAFQNRRSQDGIVVHTVSNVSAPMRVVCRDGTVAVHFASPGDVGVSVTLTGFCGDATIACEDVAPRVKFASVERTPAGGSAGSGGGVNGGASSGVSGSPEQFTDTGWLLFSNRDRAFAPLLADPREAQIRAGWMVGRDGDKFLDLGFGGDLGLLRRDFSPDEAMTLTLRGLFTARFQTDAESFPLLNTDYYGGFAFARRFGRNAWELFVFHQSAHLGDETLDFGRRERINYGREAVRFLWSHNILENLRIYGGPTLNVSGSQHYLRGRATLQAGGEYRFGACGAPMYAAADVQFRQQTEWRPNITGQLGMYLGRDKTANPKPKTRVFLELFTGYSDMGQYWNTYETSAMVGLGYNW